MRWNIEKYTQQKVKKLNNGYWKNTYQMKYFCVQTFVEHFLKLKNDIQLNEQYNRIINSNILRKKQLNTFPIWQISIWTKIQLTAK